LAPEKRNSPSRPIGIKVLVICMALYGLMSFGGVVQLFPLWLDAASHHRYGNMSFVWVEFVSALSALAAAHGLWHRRRWARVPTLVVLVLALATACLISGFGVGGVSSLRARFVVAALLLLGFALAALLFKYVWRHT